ncbi:hypothetical protein Tco_0373476 [Tanacetum coccineum]
MGNELILALPEGADDFVVYYDARSKDLEAGLEKGEGDCLYVATTEDVAWLGPTSVKRGGEWFILAIEEAYTIKYSIHPEADATYGAGLAWIGGIVPSPLGACVSFTDKWSLDELVYGVPTDGPYQTNPPSPDDIILSIRIDREVQVCRIRHEEEIDVLEYQVLTREIIMCPRVFVTCSIVSYTPNSSTLPISWQSK